MFYLLQSNKKIQYSELKEKIIIYEVWNLQSIKDCSILMKFNSNKIIKSVPFIKPFI